MRFHEAWYQMTETIAEHLPTLRPAQQRGLALWVYGAVLAHSACQNAVITALLTVTGGWHALRQLLREWLYSGADKAAPCATQVEVQACFPHLLRWVLSWWRGPQLALAVDATLHQDRLTALVVSVLYRGTAIPVAWAILPANQKGPWLAPILQLLRHLSPVIPPTLEVLLLADRGLWSPQLWRTLHALHWHPLLRVRTETTFQPEGGTRRPARYLVPGPGHAWVGRGTAFQPAKAQRGTLVVVWAAGQAEPWLVLTDLPPEAVGVSWYGLRMWIEVGFRALKGVGWEWEHTRRTDPARVTRHWLVLAVATLWVLATGTRADDAEQVGLPPGRLRAPVAGRGRPRQVSVFARGLVWLQRQLLAGRLWSRLWLVPERWPDPPPGVVITRHGPQPQLAQT